MKSKSSAPFALAASVLLTALLAQQLAPAEAASTNNIPQKEIARRMDALREAGATKEQLAKFEEILLTRGSGRAWGREYLQSAPPRVAVSLLRNTLRNEREPTPPAIFSGIQPARTCTALREVAIPDTTIDSAAVDTADGSCRVTATVIHPPAHNPIRVFIGMPKEWNGRFRGTGGAAYAGGFIENLDNPLKKGYAVGATDTGNTQGTANFALDSSGNPAWHRMRDNGYIGIHDMTVVGKSLAQAFYGRTPRYSYFVGGSTGGRQALTEAQRYPDDYDGILAINPAIARDRYVPAQLWPQILMREANNFLSKEKREAATLAAVKACDGADGVVDGVIDDPTRCHYDPAELVGTQIGDTTFTATDARIIRRIWEGPRAHDDRFLWWGPTPGTKLSTLANTDGTPLTGKPCQEGLDWFRYFLALDPKWDWTTLTRGEFELLFEQSIQTHASTYGGDNPDLTGFRDRGGKLLIVHGWADTIVTPQATVAYYQNVQQRMGGAELTAEFVRLFLVPGADHGFVSEAPTPSPAEMVGTLMAWVEQRRAPERLVAELFGDQDRLVRTRPLFAYPNVARYSGKGSTDRAENFVSSTSAR